MSQPANWNEIATLYDDEAPHQIRVLTEFGSHRLIWSCTCQASTFVNGAVAHVPLGAVDAPIEVILDRHRKHVLEAVDRAEGHGRHARRVPGRLGVLRGPGRAGAGRPPRDGPGDGVRADGGVRAVAARPGPGVPRVAAERGDR